MSYKSDLAEVEKITVDTAKRVMNKLQPNIKDFEPYIRYDEFADSSINLKVSLMAENVEDKYVLVHEFIKEISNVYRKAKIEIPYPQRDIHVKK